MELGKEVEELEDRYQKKDHSSPFSDKPIPKKSSKSF